MSTEVSNSRIENASGETETLDLIDHNIQQMRNELVTTDYIDAVQDEVAFELERMAEEGIGENVIEHLRSQFQHLHDVANGVADRGMRIVEYQDSLLLSLKKQRDELESLAQSSFDDDTTIGNLRRELMRGENEVALAKERDHLCTIEVSEVEHDKERFETRLQDLEQTQSALWEPQITTYQQEITDLKAEITRTKRQFEKHEADRDMAMERAETLRTEVSDLSMEQRQLNQTRIANKDVPDRLRKQSEALRAGLLTQQADLKITMQRLAEATSDLNGVSARTADAEKESEELAIFLERSKNNIERVELDLETLQKELEQEKEDTTSHLADRVQIDVEIRGAISDAKREHDTLLRRTHEKDHALRSLQRGADLIDRMMTDVPALQRDLGEAKRKLQQAEDSRKSTQAALKQRKIDLEMSYGHALRVEHDGKVSASKSHAEQAAWAELEAAVSSLQEQEGKLQRELQHVTNEMEVKGREYSRIEDKVKETMRAVQIRSLELEELEKKAQEVDQKTDKYRRLYDQVKAERNRHRSMIQASAQALAEMREKLVILQNEAEILTNDTRMGDKALNKQRLEIKSLTAVRDRLRKELNRLANDQRQKMELVDQQVAEVDKLNAIINSLEEQMVALKQEYEELVQDRNRTGITLVDRNDELCILYEKSNIQAGILRTAEMKSRQRAEDYHVLQLQAMALERDIDVAKRLRGQQPKYEEEVRKLKKDLISAKDEATRLSERIEHPSREDAARWQLVGRELPEVETLRKKAQDLEARLREKEEQAMEKELVLKEVSRLADELRARAEEGKSSTVEVAKKLNGYQTKLREVTRKLMATVSELSMYQASLMRLNQERADREQEVSEGRRRLEAGLPPTETTEHEWQQHIKRKQFQQEAKARRLEEQEELEELPSTAMQRPNAYIDPDSQVPRPYGKHPPFKPTVTGATMRHIRNPQNREIEL